MTRHPETPSDPFLRPLVPSTGQTGFHIRSPRTTDAADVLLGESETIRRVREQIRRVAQFASVPILVLGETGTGKELVAAAVHRLGDQADRPLVSINCAALPEALIESELFGHEAGAFTGARGSRVGLLEAAANGTLFLDEIGEMPDGCQAKLLRALEDRCFRRVGANGVVPLTARIISATNRSVRALHRSSLRPDLYYRLAGFTIALPPLRERIDDVPLLAEHFLHLFGERHGQGPERFDDEALEVLRAHRWPGNVRELRCVVDHAAILSRRDSVGAEETWQALEGRPATVAGSSIPPRSSERPPSLPPTPPASSLPDLEREMIERAMRRCGGNVSEAARLLQIPRSTLRDKLRRYADG